MFLSCAARTVGCGWGLFRVNKVKALVIRAMGVRVKKMAMKAILLIMELSSVINFLVWKQDDIKGGGSQLKKKRPTKESSWPCGLLICRCGRQVVEKKQSS